MAAHTEHICKGRQKRDKQNKCGGVLGRNKRGNGSVRGGLGEDREGLQSKSWLQTIEGRLLVIVEMLDFFQMCPWAR